MKAAILYIYITLKFYIYIYIYIAQSSQNDILIQCKRKKLLIIKHENQNFQPRLSPSSVVVNGLQLYIMHIYIHIYIYIYIYIYMHNVQLQTVVESL